MLSTRFKKKALTGKTVDGFGRKKAFQHERALKSVFGDFYGLLLVLMREKVGLISDKSFVFAFKMFNFSFENKLFIYRLGLDCFAVFPSVGSDKFICN